MNEENGNYCTDCQELVEWVAEYLEGEMDPETQRQLLVHVQTCRRCAEMLRSMKRLVNYCQLEPNCEVPRTVHQELWVSIRREIYIEHRT
jgi:anti-sigma factor RsiW